LSKPLKIAVDCRDLQIATTGTKTYLTELIAALKTLQQTGGNHTLHTNVAQDFELILIEPILGVMPGNTALSKLIRHFQFFWWKQITLPILAFFKGASILICTDYVAPIITPGFKTMVVFHDAFFWEYPQHYSRGWLRIFKWFAIASANKSISVIAPSEYAKKQIALYTGIPAAKMTVVYEAPKTFAQSQTKSQASAQHQLQISAPYFLHVGTLAKHKNLVTLIEAFALFVQKNSIDSSIKLVLVGGAPSSVHSNDEPNIIAAIQKHNLQNRVLLTGYVSSDAVANWYSGAMGYVFPSRNEGFGLPMLEAMCYHLPIIAANNTCLPEIGHGAALYFDPNNAPQIAVLLEAIVNNDPSVIASVNAQSIVLQQFSWKKAANQFIQIAAKGLNNAPKHA
jgi:glycosyltransferase involved in cell wall biosynthesis